ncbi:MAG TPA: PspA/IM30 family protein [Candidatus Baltobacteraceae bacterium]|nr:PspA/IM30 family protein [Candidatus Baltobacteraceae bacterium]
MSVEPETFIDRILRIFRQKAVANLNRLDDPAEAIDVVLAGQLESINRARGDLAAVATAQKRLAMMATEFEQRAARHLGEAKAALASANEAGARTSMRRAMECEHLAADARAQHDQIAAQRAELERLLDQMRSNYDRLRVRRESVAAQSAAARATVQGNEALTPLGEGAQRERELERARLALSEQRAKADAVTELRQSGAIDSVGPEEFDSRPLVNDADVEQRLRALSE